MFPLKNLRTGEKDKSTKSRTIESTKPDNLWQKLKFHILSLEPNNCSWGCFLKKKLLIVCIGKANAKL